MINYLKIESLQQLTEVLMEHDIPIHRWGHGLSGTVEDLFKQITLGKAKLGIEEEGLKKQTSYVQVVLYHPTTPTLWHRVVEVRKVLKDGSSKDFDRLLGVRKKLSNKEDPLQVTEQVLHVVMSLKKPCGTCFLGTFIENDLSPRRHLGLPTERIYNTFGAITLEPVNKIHGRNFKDEHGVRTFFKCLPEPFCIVPPAIQDLFKQTLVEV